VDPESSSSSFIDLYDIVPTQQQLDTIPGFRAAYVLQRQAHARWNTFRMELAQRLAAVPFAELLWCWQAAEHGPDEHLKSAYNAIVRDRLRYTFFGEVFDDLVTAQDWETIASYFDLELMLSDAEAWRQWWFYENDDDDLFMIYTPSLEEIDAKIAQLRGAIPRLQQYRTDRNVAIAESTHGRLGQLSRMRQIEPLLLREIAHSAHYTRYPFGTEFLKRL
jgi:hypothetical protein